MSRHSLAAVEPEVRGAPPKCLGLAGWLLGHRFSTRVGNLDVQTHYCGRCGQLPWRPEC